MDNTSIAALDGPRPARADEIDQIIALANLVFRPSGRGGDMAGEFPVLLAGPNAENLYIFRDGKRVVSLVGVHRQTIITHGVRIPAACIGSVCTDPEYRGRGLASVLMDLAIARSRDAGDLLMPISGNRTLYRMRGATQIGPEMQFDVRLGGEAFAAQEFRVREYGSADWQGLSALQRPESPRWHWNGDETPRLLQSYLDFGGTCLLAEDATGALVASLLFCSGSPLFMTEPDCGRVVQFVGRAEAIGALLESLRQRTKLNVLTWSVLQPAQPGVAQCLQDLGATCQTRTAGWTLVILNLPGLVDLLAPVVARSGLTLSADQCRLTLTAGEQSVCVSGMGRQIELLFRAQACWSAALDGLPADLRMASAGALPVPLCSYGINFV